MKVTIIGAGNMGRGIGMRAVAGGHDVEVIDRNPEDAQARGLVDGQLVYFAPNYAEGENKPGKARAGTGEPRRGAGRADGSEAISSC